MKFDFHCHSDISDGLLSPVELADYAVEREIQLLALTDHDSVSGLKLMTEYIFNNKLPIQIINGVEISALTDFGEVHIVGLNIDPTSESLLNALEFQIEQRWQRARDICDKLSQLGVEGVLEQLEIKVKEVVTRTHIAKEIVELGYAKDMQQAFKRYLGKNGKVKVAKNWMSMAKAIQLIENAGGIPVLAHPTRYPLSNRKLSLLIESFKEQGGQALEMSYPSLNKDKIEWLKIHQEKNNLIASSGSDFHYPNLRWTDLGRFPFIDNNIPHVLQKLNNSRVTCYD